MLSVQKHKSRVKRVSAGSGTNAADVNRLTNQFEAIQKMTKQMAGLGAMGKIRAMRELSKMESGGMAGAGAGMHGLPGLGGKGSTKTQSIKARFKQRKKR
jgi:signal recognition particle subunit SRP54